MREPILALGKYEIIQAIGSGGMATVYHARLSGPMGFEKPVAVKVLQDDAAADEEIVRMFVDEARLGARLTHPNIAGVMEFGEADGRYFLAMEYVDGMSLSMLLKRRPKGKKAKGLDPAAAVHVTSCILKALAYAQALPGPDGKPLAVVHRDVSPQNVLLDRSGAAKLCDFGIATGTWRAEKTRFGLVKGKVGYMAPEQSAGGKVDTRTDLYAVGLTLVAMLTGSAPFDGKDTGEIRAKAAKGLPKDRVDVFSCDDGLKDVLLRALAMRPADRFASADEFLKALTTAAPDPTETGRVALAAALETALEKPPSTRSGTAKAAVAKPSRKRPSTRSSETADSAAGIRNVLIGAGLLMLVALALALLKIGLPD